MVRLPAAFLMSVVFAAAAQSERSTVDFRNFEYPLPNMEEKGEMPASWKWLPSVPTTRVRIRNGEFREPTPDLGPGPSVRWVSTVWGDIDGDGRPEAAVDLRYQTAGTAGWAMAAPGSRIRVESSKRARMVSSGDTGRTIAKRAGQNKGGEPP